MSFEIGQGLDGRGDRADETIDTRRDPKAAAVQTLRDFIGISPDFILQGHTLPSMPHAELVRVGSESPRSYTPNQLLARSMLGLHSAVTALRQKELFIETGDELVSEWTIVDGHTGQLCHQRFRASKTGSDFGSFLSCEMQLDNESETSSDGILHVTLPDDSYLLETLNWGRPHEPVFYACEPDNLSPEWSTEEKARMPNGGVAERVFDEHRAWFDDEGNIVTGNYRRDVYRRRSIYYRPLYNQNAAGIERYVEITQELLRMLVMSYEERQS